MHDWQQLARDALEQLGDEVSRRGYPTWLRVFEEGHDDTELRVEAYDDPVGLLGWTAPDDCIAVGIVATGRATVTRDISQDDSGHLTREGLAQQVNDAGGAPSLRMACVVSREEGLGWWMELPDGSSHTEPPGAGRVFDVLHRCLGLPTSPPDQPAAEVHSAAWLASVIDGALASGRRLTWSDVEQLHPLARLLSGDLDVRFRVWFEDETMAQEELDGLLRIAASAWSWTEIRNQAANGRLEAFIDADLAGWMDDGMFSRWMLSMMPAVDQLLEAAEPLVVPSAARRLARAVHRAPATAVALDRPPPAKGGSGRDRTLR